jgi:hypothetical protein
MGDVNPTAEIMSPSNWFSRNYQYITAALSVALLVPTLIMVPIAWNSANAVTIYVLLFLWAFLPPIAFWLEHFAIYRNWGRPGTFELYKHGQLVSAAAWAGMLAALIAIGSSDRFKQNPATAGATQGHNVVGLAVGAGQIGVGQSGDASGSGWKASDYNAALQAIALVLALFWFGIRLLFQRQFDAAVELDVKVAVLGASPAPAHQGWCAVELAAVVKNVTIVGADVMELEWSVIPERPSLFPGWAGSWLEGGQPMSPADWNRGGEARLQKRSIWRWKDRALLTRDTTWRFSTVLDLPKNELFKLTARCDLGLQVPRQHVRHQSVISTYLSPVPTVNRNNSVDESEA